MRKYNRVKHVCNVVKSLVCWKVTLNVIVHHFYKSLIMSSFDPIKFQNC